MLKIMTKSRARRQWAQEILTELSARARAPVFFEKLNVADTIDGRFDLVVLHAFLVLERLSGEGRRDLAQAFLDVLFVSFDEGLRDLGAGDIGMGRRMKSMANAFYGRLDAYRKATGEEALAAAVWRNVYRQGEGSEGSARKLARYMLKARVALAAGDIASGKVSFGPLPEWEDAA